MLSRVLTWQPAGPGVAGWTGSVQYVCWTDSHAALQGAGREWKGAHERSGPRQGPTGHNGWVRAWGRGRGRCCVGRKGRQLDCATCPRITHGRCWDAGVGAVRVVWSAGKCCGGAGQWQRCEPAPRAGSGRARLARRSMALGKAPSAGRNLVVDSAVGRIWEARRAIYHREPWPARPRLADGARKGAGARTHARRTRAGRAVLRKARTRAHAARPGAQCELVRRCVGRCVGEAGAHESSRRRKISLGRAYSNHAIEMCSLGEALGVPSSKQAKPAWVTTPVAGLQVGGGE